MGFFARIFLSHLGVVLVASVGITIIAGVISPGLYKSHLDSIALLVKPEFVALRITLEEGYRQTMLWALAIAVPASLLLATGAAYLEARRMAAAVQRLAQGSRSIAEGQYSKRLDIAGKDELAVLARHFNKMASSLEEAERTRAELIASVAHELKTPLTALRGYTEALVDDILTPERAAQAIAREASTMQRLADDLLLVTTVEAGAFKLEPAAFEVHDLIAEVQDRFGHAFEEKGQALCTEVAQSLPRVYADRERVEQVLNNLLSNALRYAKGGSVVLGAQARGDTLQFAVADNGPGIPPEHQAHVFRRFYRVDAAHSRHEGRTGIGLTVARGLVEAMGGRIWLESEVGRGTTFYFTLPAVA